MRAKVVGIAAIILVAAVAAYALSPYLTGSTVDEAAPSNVAVAPGLPAAETEPADVQAEPAELPAARDRKSVV